MLNKPLEQRLHDAIKINNNGCWEWVKNRNKDGYGGLRYKSKTWMAHRLSYTFYKGPIPEGMLVCHKCDNPPCINPDHLFIGNNSDNMMDAYRKGRWKGVLGYRKKTCKGENHWYSKFKPEIILEIRKLFKSGLRIIDICNKYNMNHATVSDICKRRSWKHLL